MTLLMRGREGSGGVGRHQADDAVEDTLDEEERTELESTLTEADAEIDRGEGLPVEQFLADLRARRSA